MDEHLKDRKEEKITKEEKRQYRYKLYQNRKKKNTGERMKKKKRKGEKRHIRNEGLWQRRRK